MTITLNHTIVWTHDKERAARFFAEVFGLRLEGSGGHFTPVRVNDTLTLPALVRGPWSAHLPHRRRAGEGESRQAQRHGHISKIEQGISAVATSPRHPSKPDRSSRGLGGQVF
jgi:catechol 2,3-dioxygenase-like lactoylglutathione lyase family enzyme